MGFIKCVLCKIDHFVIDLIGRFLIDPVGDTARHIFLRIAIHKILPLFLHHIALFLGHGTP